MLLTQIQNRSFHVVEKMRMAVKFLEIKNAHAKCAKLLFFIADLRFVDILVAINVMVS